MHEANRLSPAGAPRLGFALTILAAALLAACNPGGRPGAHDLSLATPPAARAAGEASEQIGTGSIKIALIVPLTQASGPSVVGASLRNEPTCNPPRTKTLALAHLGFMDDSELEASSAVASKWRIPLCRTPTPQSASRPPCT